MRRLIDLEDKGDLETLSELLDWLVEQKAWNLVDELAARYGSRFENEPMLLYILAHAQKEQGEAAKAEETVRRAFGINAGREQMSLLNRYIPLNLMNLYRDAVMGREEMKLLNRYLIAERLIQRRLFAWASANWNTSSPRAAPRTSPPSMSNGAFRKCSTTRATIWRPPMSWTAC